MANEVNVLLIFLLLAAGCSGRGDTLRSTGEAQPTTAEPRAGGGFDVRLPLLPPGGSGHQVGAIGALEVDGPCLYLRAPNGSRTLPVFATPSTRWNREAGWLEVGDKKFMPGQTVTLGGSPSDTLPSGIDWLQKPDSRCTAPRVFITNSIEPGG